MQIKTFLAKDMRDALKRVRDELGEDAVIVASQTAKDGGVIVRAAVDREVQADGQTRRPAIEPTSASPLPAPGWELTNFDQRYRETLVARLRTPAPVQTGTKRVPLGRAALLGLLGFHRVPDSLAPKLAEQAEKSGLADPVLALAAALDKNLQPTPVDMHAAAILVLAGPPGAGKTTIAAKLAAHAKLAGRNAVLVATDVNGAGALQRLETFAAHLDTDCVAADNAEAFAAIAAQARQDGSLLIADTAGIDARAPESWRTLLAFTENDGTELLGVLPATMDAEEVSDMARALAQLGAGRAIATHCDLVRRQGAITALAFSGLRIAHVTASAYLASGLEILTPLRLARALIEGADMSGAVRSEIA